MVATSNLASAVAKVVSMPEGFGVGLRFTFAITSDGIGTL